MGIKLAIDRTEETEDTPATEKIMRIAFTYWKRPGYEENVATDDGTNPDGNKEENIRADTP